MHGWVVEWMDSPLSGCMDGVSLVNALDGWLSGWMGGWLSGRMDGWLSGLHGWVVELMHLLVFGWLIEVDGWMGWLSGYIGWVVEWMHGWVVQWMHGWVVEWIAWVGG